jgi:tetratricopeptide (TPR) repeat protein
MRPVACSLFILFLASSTCVGGTVSPASLERVRTLSLSGFALAYNYDFNQANQRFDEALAIEPRHPRPYVGKAMMLFWRYLLSRNAVLKDSCITIADRGIEAAEALEDDLGDDAETQICLGTLYGYRSFVKGRSKSYLGAAWDGKRSYDCFVRALEINPKAYDAYLGLGLYHYFITFIPKPLRWIASVMGISGDADQGMKELRIAGERGVFAKTEARYYLAQFLPWHNGDFETGEQIYRELLAEYPANRIIDFSLAVWELRRHDVTAARARLEQLLKTAPADTSRGIETFVRYKLAECYFRLNDWPNALAAYRSLLRGYDDETYMATALYRAGVCLEFTGRRDSAVAYYRRSAAAHHHFGDDAYSARKAAMKMKSRLLPSDSLLIVAGNCFAAGSYDAAVKLFTTVKGLVPPGDETAVEAEFGAGYALFEQGRYDSAAAFFARVSRATVKQELWLQPWSYYFAGQCALKRNAPSEAKAAFERVADYDDYDFDNWLSFRSRRELEKLEH